MLVPNKKNVGFKYGGKKIKELSRWWSSAANSLSCKLMQWIFIKCVLNIYTAKHPDEMSPQIFMALTGITNV